MAIQRSFLVRPQRFAPVLFLSLFFCSGSPAQAPPRPAREQTMNTGLERQGNFDAQHRPVTAGGTVKTGPVIFQNIAAQAGLASWHNQTGGSEKKLIIEAKGSGVCLIDYDRDGWLDIYFVNGSTFTR